ncbi:MAG: DUF1573 domain-containing protein [bacterium]
MNRISLVMLLALVFLTSSCFSQPKLEIEGGDTYDWGKINPKGQPLTAQIKFFNRGTDTLKITEVKPGCGCTTAPLDKNNIEPGGFATLSVTLKVSSDGPVSKSITIRSNDQAFPVKYLILKAEITSPIGLSVPYIAMTNMNLNQETISKITIKNNTAKIVKMDSVIIEPKGLLVNIKKGTKIPANSEISLEVKFTPKEAKNMQGKISIYTNSAEQKKVDISVWGYMATPMEKTPTK